MCIRDSLSILSPCWFPSNWPWFVDAYIEMYFYNWIPVFLLLVNICICQMQWVIFSRHWITLQISVELSKDTQRSQTTERDKTQECQFWMRGAWGVLSTWWSSCFIKVFRSCRQDFFLSHGWRTGWPFNLNQSAIKICRLFDHLDHLYTNLSQTNSMWGSEWVSEWLSEWQCLLLSCPQ